MQQVNETLTKVESKFEQQQKQVHQLLDNKMTEAESKIAEADTLLKNVRGAFAIQNEKV